MAAKLFFLPFPTAFNSNGLAVSGAQATFYVTGTTTKAAVYTSAALTTAHPNPVAANGAGRFADVYLNSAVTYRVVIADADGTTLEDVDPYVPGTIVAGAKGDPGGNAAAIGLKTAASGLTIATGTDMVQTSGYSVTGTGAALYVYDATVDSTYVNANPLTSFRNATTGRGYRLHTGQRLTPTMFGAVGMNIASVAATYDQATLDTSTDDAVALQAFFDFAFTPGRAGLVFDFTGHWAVSSPLFLGRPLSTGATGLTVEYHGRKFICGHLHVLPVAQQPGGVAMTDVLTAMGPNIDLKGELYIHDSAGGGSSYASRRFKNGLKVYQTTEGSIESVTVNGAKRDAVIVDTTVETWTLRSSPYVSGSTTKNSIGLKIGRIYAAGCGSCGLSAGKGYSTAIVSKAQGGDPAQNGVFEGTAASYTGSLLQRTRITVASTAEFAVGDYIRSRIEIPTASFTTVAASNATGKLTLAAGDAVTLGLAVGSKITLVDGNAVGGLNAGTEFLILDITAANRDLTVYPKPTTEAAKAYTFINSQWMPHKVQTVESATQLLVFPWLPDATNSAVYLCQGYALNTFGQDGANINVGYVGAFLSGGGFRSAGLYGAHVGELLTDYAEIGVAIGSDYGAASIGTQVDHRHFEATTFNVIQASSGASWSIGDGSNITQSAWGFLGVRAATSSALMTTIPLRGQHIIDKGRTFDFHNDVLGLTNYMSADDQAVSNDPAYRQRIYNSNGGTVKLDFDRDMLRLDNVAEASLVWMGPTYLPPTGTITFSLSTRLTDSGWAIAGTSTLTAPGKVAVFRIVFDDAARTVAVHPINFVGYSIGGGGAVTQATNKATGVTLNRPTGQITLNNASLAGSTSVGFTLTDSNIAAGDVVAVSIASGGTAASYMLAVDSVGAGTATIHLRNVSAGALAEAVVLNFAVIKGSAT